jgi:TatD DNase family protein
MSNPATRIPSLPAGAYLVDTHCHLDMSAYEDLEDVIGNAERAGVRRIIAVGIDMASSHAAVSIAGRYRNVAATIGVHPHSAAAADTGAYRELAGLAAGNPGLVAGYGEIGLDYVKKYAHRDNQLRAFRSQLHLARDLHLPVVIHDREAHEDTLAILRETGLPAEGGVMHCFSGDVSLAREVIDLGLQVSIPGIVTFAGSETLQQVVREIPLENMLLETDGPFLAPVPFRGKTNLPAYLPFTALKIAELRNISIEEVARQTTANAENLFRLKDLEAVH